MKKIFLTTLAMVICFCTQAYAVEWGAKSKYKMNLKVARGFVNECKADGCDFPTQDQADDYPNCKNKPFTAWGYHTIVPRYGYEESITPIRTPPTKRLGIIQFCGSLPDTNRDWPQGLDMLDILNSLIIIR